MAVAARLRTCAMVEQAVESVGALEFRPGFRMPSLVAESGLLSWQCKRDTTLGRCLKGCEECVHGNRRSRPDKGGLHQ